MDKRAGKPAESGKAPRAKRSVRGESGDKKRRAGSAGRSESVKRSGSVSAGRPESVKRSGSVSAGRSESVKRSGSVSAGRSERAQRSVSGERGQIRRSGRIASRTDRTVPYRSRGKRKMKKKEPERNVFSQDGQKKSISLVLAVAVVVILVAAVSINVWSLGRHLRENNARIEEVRKELASEEQRAADIEEYRRYTETDSYIEEIAREKLGLIYEGETVFKEEK